MDSQRVMNGAASYVLRAASHRQLCLPVDQNLDGARGTPVVEPAFRAAQNPNRPSLVAIGSPQASAESGRCAFETEVRSQLRRTN